MTAASGEQWNRISGQSSYNRTAGTGKLRRTAGLGQLGLKKGENMTARRDS
jgi:hypothetical protein